MACRSRRDSGASRSVCGELSEQGDPLEKLVAIVDFELFRPVLDEALGRMDRSKGGRPPFDAILKFKMLYLQAQHGLGFEATEHLVRDRLSWMRFCGLTIAEILREPQEAELAPCYPSVRGHVALLAQGWLASGDTSVPRRSGVALCVRLITDSAQPGRSRVKAARPLGPLSSTSSAVMRS